MGRGVRSAIAWLRLGGWVWQGIKGTEGYRECPLCGGRDGVWHLLGNCIGLERERSGLEGRIFVWNYKNWVKTKDRTVVAELGKFLLKAREKRGKKQ